MERSLIYMILGLGLVWVLLDELFGKHKLITGIVTGIVGESK